MFELLLVLTPVALGYFIGNAIEQKHFRSLAAREEKIRHIPLVNGQRYIDSARVIDRVELVTGHVVLAQDAFKTFVASIVNLFGGTMVGLETLLDRGRREAILRMFESATGQPDTIINVRLQTSNVGLNATGAPEGNAETFAYGTAIYYR